jgi:predicted DNA-binding transcriptional regulator AlpA
VTDVAEVEVSAGETEDEPEPVIQVLRVEELRIHRELLTAAEVARLCGVHRSTVYRTEGLPAPVRIGRVWRWRRSDIEQLVGRSIAGDLEPTQHSP